MHRPRIPPGPGGAGAGGHVALFAAALTAWTAVADVALAQESAGGPAARVLVFSHTAGYRHASIPDGIAMIRKLGEAHGFMVEHTEDPAFFETADLGRYGAIVWLSTTGDVLGPRGEAAFEKYVQGGGGYVGIHAAADTEYGWPWYGRLLGCGAWFRSHPAIQPARVAVTQRDHPSTRHLPESLMITDEWYNYRASARGCAEVLLALDESSYEPGIGAMGDDHPFAWYHELDGGRAWYTGLGHRSELYAMPEFREHVLGGILWAAGLAR